jgi:hypothetical protein
MKATTTRLEFEPVKYRDIVLTLDRPELFKIVGLTVGLALLVFALGRLLRRAAAPFGGPGMSARTEGTVQRILAVVSGYKSKSCNWLRISASMEL